MENKTGKTGFLALAALALLIIANIIYYLAPRFMFSSPGPDAPFRLFMLGDPAIDKKNGLIAMGVFLLLVPALLLLLVQAVLSAKRLFSDWALVVACAVFAASFPLFKTSLSGARTLAGQFSPVGLIEVPGDAGSWPVLMQEGFEIRLPKKFKTYKFGSLDGDEAYGKGLPFSYTSFVPAELLEGGKQYERFELRVSIYQNRDRLSLNDFWSKKNEKLKSEVKEFQLVSDKQMNISGAAGLEDEIVVAGPLGRQSYCRAVVQYRDRFFVISSVVGRGEAIPQYRSLFDAFVSGFKISGKQPQPKSSNQKSAKHGFLQLW